MNLVPQLLLPCMALLVSYFFWDTVQCCICDILLLTSCIIGFCLGLIVVLSNQKYLPVCFYPPSKCCKILGRVKNWASFARSKKQIVTTHNLDFAIQELMDLVIRDYILSWYTHVGRDTDLFSNVIQSELWTAVENFSLHIEKIDKTTFLSEDCVNAISDHLDMIQQANRSDDLLKPAFALHSCLRNEASELNHIREVVEVFLTFLAPKAYTRCSCTRHLLREILTNRVFKPAIDLITDPYYLNSTLHNWLTYREQLQAEHSRTFTYASTYEEFMSIIKRCSDLEHLKHMRLNVISEIMLSTTLQNIKKSRGIDTDKSLSPKAMDKGELLHSRNLPKYINQLKVAKATCEKRIHRLGGAEYLSYIEESQQLERIPGKKVLSFEVIMHSMDARSHLASFLKKSGKESLVRYWEAVEDMKKASRSEQHRLANQIYERFLSQKSSQILQVLDAVVLKSIKAYMIGNGGPEGFWESQLAIYSFTEEEHYGSFIASDIYHRHVSELGDRTTSPDLLGSLHPSQTDLKSDLPVGDVSTSGEIALHSTYALEKLEILDDRILNKREALDAMQQLQKKDPETRKMQEDMARELDVMITERKQLEFHVNQTDIWIRYLGQWKGYISNADVVRVDNKNTIVFVIVVNPVGISKQATFQKVLSAGSSDASWIVTRKLEDFKTLHRELVQIVPSIRRHKLPSRSVSHGAESLRRLREALQHYLNCVLDDDILAQSEPVFAFLSKSLDLLKRSISERELKSSKALFSMPTIFKKMALSFDKLASSKSLNESDREVTMDTTAQPLYNLISNIFELTGGSNWLRRTLVALVQVTYGKSINRKIYETIEWIVSEPMLIYYLHLFRDAYWPRDQPAHRAAPPRDEQKHTMRLLAKQKLLNSVPVDESLRVYSPNFLLVESAALKNLIGEEKARHGTAKVFEAWQDSRINKHIFYTVLEMFMMEAFADSKDDARRFGDF